MLEFLLEDHTFSMPVGRIDFLHLGPVTFFEFLEARGEKIVVEQLLTFDSKFFNLHRELMEKRLREYYFVGGMPQAIQSYLDTKSVLEVSKIHSSILQTYKSDFSRYNTRLDTTQIGRIFDLLPNALGKKIKHGSLFLDEKSKVVSKVLDMFSMAKIILKCAHTNASSVPLSSTSDPDVYKIYHLDIGLLHHLQGLLPEEILVERKDSRSNVAGLSTEQFVAQHLLYAGPSYEESKLFYWLKDKTQTKAEVDFIINRGKQIIPIEVKSGKSGTLKSLFHFMETHKYNMAYRFFLGQEEKSFYTETTS